MGFGVHSHWHPANSRGPRVTLCEPHQLWDTAYTQTKESKKRLRKRRTSRTNKLFWSQSILNTSISFTNFISLAESQSIPCSCINFTMFYTSRFENIWTKRSFTQTAACGSSTKPLWSKTFISLRSSEVRGTTLASALSSFGSVSTTNTLGTRIIRTSQQSDSSYATSYSHTKMAWTYYKYHERPLVE